MWAQSTGRILSHHRRSGNCAGRSIKRGSALGFCRSNLQCWTSLPVYYQVVYFTVAISVCAFRDLFLSLSFPPSLVFLRHLQRSMHGSSLLLRFSLTLFPRYIYRNVLDDVGPFAMLSMTRSSLPAVFPPPRPSLCPSLWSDIGWFLIFASYSSTCTLLRGYAGNALYI